MALVNKTVNPVPYVGTRKICLYRVNTDNTETYEADGDMIELVGGAVSVSYSISASETAFYADNSKQISEFSYSPTGALGIAGDNEELDVLLLGKKKDGGAVLENMGSVPECGCFYILDMGKNKWVVRQILRFTAAKDETTVSTKGETTTFTNPGFTVSPLLSNYFQSYTRDFYSTDEALKDMTAEQVIEALKANPATTFPAVGV